MTSASVPTPVHDRDAGGPNLAQGTGGPRAGHDADLIQGAEGDPRVHDGGGHIHETEAAAVAQGIEGKRRSQKNVQRRPQKATAVPGGPEVSVGGTVEAVAHLARLGKGSPHLHLPDVIKKRRRRTKIVTRNETGERTQSKAEAKESALGAKRRKVKIRNEIESTSLTVRRET